MNYSDFANRYIANHTTFNLAYINKTINNIENCFGEQPDLNLMKDKDIINSLFFVNYNNRVDRNKVVIVKSLLSEFYNQVYPEGEDKQLLISYINSMSLDKIFKCVNIETSYFTSYENLLSYFDKICLDYNIYPSESLIFIKAISYLSWYGFDNNTMINLTKQEIIDNSYAKKMPFKLDQIQEFEELLRNYATREDITSFPGRKTMSLKPSKYLFRSAKEEQFVSEDAIVSALRRFNKEVHIYGKIISRTSLKMNGLFCYLEKKYGKNILNNDICYELNCFSSRAYEIKSEYLAWLDWKKGI